LNDPDLNKAYKAAELLGEFGDAKAKQALFERLRRFHAQWIKREAEFRFRPNMPREISEANMLQMALEHSLGCAQGWILTDAEITELEQLVMEPGQKSISYWHLPNPEKSLIGINIDLDEFRVVVDRYQVHNIGALQAKLAQFPAGTGFSLVFF